MNIKDNYFGNIINNNKYLTKSNRIGGSLKCYPEDFIVTEISSFKKASNGNYIILELIKTNWDLNHFIKFISKMLGISSKRIGFAGTKDKKAITTQKISIYNIQENQINLLNIKDIKLNVLGYSNKQIEIGDLIKNQFSIIIRNLEYNKETTLNILNLITKEIIDNNGVPNYYGVQRFGDKRPITHLVGYYLLKREFKTAVMIYLTYFSNEEEESAKKMRIHVLNTEHFKEGLKLCPQYLGYEKIILNSLIKQPSNFLDSILCLPDNLCMMFIHAYQSQLFNCIISQRLSCNLKLNEAIIGDIVCYNTKDKIPDPKNLEKVTSENINGINNLIKKQRTYITAPLIGYETEFASGQQGEIEKNIFNKSKLTLSDFYFNDIENNKIKVLYSKGLRKEILLIVKPKYEIVELLKDYIVKIDFELPKGSYATTVLREYMKN